MEPTQGFKYDPRIDVLRAIAFLLVTVVHFAVPTWTNSVGQHNVLEILSYSLIETGWLGVPLFLFISGYSLAIGKIEKGHINLKNFFINRILRIYPIWIIVILILSFTHHISGTTVFYLLFLQTQDLPSSTAFNICWSIQLEFMCYLIFPILLSIATNQHSSRKKWRGIVFFLAFLFLVRLDMSYIRSITFPLSYGTLFGAGTVFLAGMITVSLKPLKSGLLSKISLASGIILFCGLAVYLSRNGGTYGYAIPDSTPVHRIFEFFPEIISIIIFLIIRGTLTEGIPSAMTSNILVKGFIHMGKVSYSGFVFSMFVLDFVQHEFTRLGIIPTGWVSMAFSFSTYLAVLILFATVSFNAVELPFLNMRRSYLNDHSQQHSEPPHRF